MTDLELARDIVSRCLLIPKEKIQDDDELQSAHGIDSLNFTMIIVEVERHVQREIDPLQILELRTLRDLAALLGRLTP